jgi:hypothetical protein
MQKDQNLHRRLPDDAEFMKVIIPYYTVPRDILKWILSFIVYPADFMRLRRVCKEWNNLLGELFFGTVRVNRDGLLRLLKILQYTFEREIPFILAKDTLTVSAGIKQIECSVYVECPVETNGIENTTPYYFTMSTESLLKMIDQDSREYVVFFFSDRIGKIMYGSIVSRILKDACRFKIYLIAYAREGLRSPVSIPSYDLEFETNVEMFQSILDQSNQPRVSLRIYSTHNYRGEYVLVLSCSPEDIDDFASQSQPMLVFKEQGDDPKVKRWKPTDLYDAHMTEHERMPYCTVEDRNFLVRRSFYKHSIVNSLCLLNPLQKVSLCIEESGHTALILKYSIEWCKDQIVNIHWFFK